MKLRLAALEWDPVSLLQKYDNQTLTFKECPTRSLLKILANSLNFSYELFTPADGEYGTPSENGSWSGMVGMLQRNECDITITPMTVTHQRLPFIKFSKELFPDPYTISSQSGNDVENDLIDFLKSVDSFVWLLLFVSIFLITSINSLHLKLMGIKISFYRQFWQLFRVLLFQTHLRLESLSIYSILTSLFVLCYFIITNWFTSLIGSLMVIGLQKTVIETLSQLAEAKDVVPTLYFGTGVETYFKKSDLKDNIEIWRRIKANENLALLKSDSSYTNPELIQLLRDGKAAMIEARNDAIILKIYYCKLYPDLRMHMSKETFYNAMQALGYRIDLDLNLIKKIDKLIHAIQAHGFLDKWFAKMFYDYAAQNDTKLQLCVHDQWDKIDGINYIDLKNMRTCFYLLGCGIGFAVFLFVCEIVTKSNILKNAKNHYKQNNNVELPHSHYNRYSMKHRF